MHSTFTESFLGKFLICVSVCMCQLDKITRKEMESDLQKVNVPGEAIEGILHALTLQSFDDLEG